MAASVLCRRTVSVSFRASSCKHAFSPGGFLLQTACYNPKPLRLNLKDPYIPEKDSENTPEWQKSAKYDRKLFGRYGSASGIDPASLWPSHAELDKIIAEENEWHPPLEVMLKNIEAREKEEAEKRREKWVKLMWLMLTELMSANTWSSSSVWSDLWLYQGFVFLIGKENQTINKRLNL